METKTKEEKRKSFETAIKKQTKVRDLLKLIIK